MRTATATTPVIFGISMFHFNLISFVFIAYCAQRGCLMVYVLPSIVADRGCIAVLVKRKTMQYCICIFPIEVAILRSKSKYLLTRSKDNGR